MASVADLIAQTHAALGTVEEALQDIAGFEVATENTIALVTTALTGSTNQHDQQMIAALVGARRSLVIAEGSLSRASEALRRVQQI